MHQDEEVGQWLDRLAIMDAINRYSDSVTRGDYEHTAELFAPDAVWEERGGEHFETADEFVTYLVEGSATLEVLIQTPHSSVIVFTGALELDGGPPAQRRRGITKQQRRHVSASST